MFAPRKSLPWNRKYVYTFGDLVVNMSKSRSLSLAGRILLKQYIKDCLPSKQEYLRLPTSHLFSRDVIERSKNSYYAPTIISYEQPGFDSSVSKGCWHRIFTKSWRTSERVLKMVSIMCATCGEDTGETTADPGRLYYIFTGRNYYCSDCTHKVSRQTYMAANKGLGRKWYYEGDDKLSYLREVLIIAKQLHPPSVTPSRFL